MPKKKIVEEEIEELPENVFEEEPVEKPVEKLEAKLPSKEELLEYHLSRVEGNLLNKSQVRAIFASLFR